MIFSHCPSFIKDYIYKGFIKRFNPNKTASKGSDLSSPRPWGRHQMDSFSALPTLCEGNPPVTAGFSSQRPVMRSFGVFFYLHLNETIVTPVIWDTIALIMATLKLSSLFWRALSITVLTYITRNIPGSAPGETNCGQPLYKQYIIQQICMNA